MNEPKYKETIVTMKTDFNGYCSDCKTELPKGAERKVHRFSKRIYCVECADRVSGALAARKAKLAETQQASSIEPRNLKVLDEVLDIVKLLNKRFGVLDKSIMEIDKKLNAVMDEMGIMHGEDISESDHRSKPDFEPPKPETMDDKKLIEYSKSRTAEKLQLKPDYLVLLNRAKLDIFHENRVITVFTDSGLVFHEMEKIFKELPQLRGYRFQFLPEAEGLANE